MKTINKKIQINAAGDKVWQVLTDNNLTQKWYAVFSASSVGITDWAEGSEARFIDGEGTGLVGRVVVNIPQQKLSLIYHGVIVNHKEFFEGAEAEEWKGATETYELMQEGGEIILTVVLDVPDRYEEIFSNTWDKAMEVIKEMAETLQSV